MPLGGPHGSSVAAALDVPFAPVFVARPTRQCLTLLDGPRSTEFNELPPALCRIELEGMADAFHTAQVSILSGRASPDFGEDAWATLLKTVRYQGEPAIVNASGRPLTLAARKADYVKPALLNANAVSRAFEGVGGIVALAAASV